MRGVSAMIIFIGAMILVTIVIVGISFTLDRPMQTQESISPSQAYIAQVAVADIENRQGQYVEVTIQGRGDTLVLNNSLIRIGTADNIRDYTLD